MTKREQHGFDTSTADGQKRLMAVSAGLPEDTYLSRPIVITEGDHGADPFGDGTFRMVPSGDIVDFDERCRRLARFERSR